MAHRAEGKEQRAKSKEHKGILSFLTAGVPLEKQRDASTNRFPTNLVGWALPTEEAKLSRNWGKAYSESSELLFMADT
jgi:hypothetical protein